MITQTVSLADESKVSYGKRLAWVLILVLALLIWLPEIKALWLSWASDSSLSHGPLVPIVVAGLLWTKREQLRTWASADWRGLAGLLITVLVYIAAVFADVDFLKPFALIGASLCGIWFLGGVENFRTCIGPIGFLIFMVPWPTLLVERLAFPLQLISSAYAALFAGILGVPIHKEGVQLLVQPNPDARPIYSIVVAQQCSGLTSLAVLLAIAYLIGYFTPIKFVWRVLLVGAVIPLAIVTNATRLTIVLLLGSHGNAPLALWVHDHEGPVLICFCSIVLLNLRRYLISRSCIPTKTEMELRREREANVSFPAADIEPDSAGSAAR